MIRLKELRENAKIEQKTLAIDLHVSQPTISDWESGKKTPSIENIVRLADYFHVSIDYLMYRSTIHDLSNTALSSVQNFLFRLAGALNLDADQFSSMISEMSVKDMQMLLAPSVCVPAEPHYRLKRARFSAGLRQADLAKKLNIPLQEYIEYESGKKSLSYKMIIGVPVLLNVNPDWLCCNIVYIDPSTGNAFDPGKYKSLVDSAYDPIDCKLDRFEFLNPDFDTVAQVRSIQEHPDFYEMILQLNSNDFSEIRGEVRQMLKSCKYTSNSPLEDERILEIIAKAPADMTKEEFDIYTSEILRQSIEEKKQASQASSAPPSAEKMA